MSYKTRSKKRAIRRQQKQARAANAQMDELFRKREAWRRVQRRRVAASEGQEQRTAVGEAKSKAEASQV